MKVFLFTVITTIVLSVSVYAAPQCYTLDPDDGRCIVINSADVKLSDVDCDGLADYDNEYDRNCDGRPDGRQTDNCINIPNGYCSGDFIECDVDNDEVISATEMQNPECADFIKCDVNKDGKLTEAEYRAGAQTDKDRNGIGDACDDSDGDGVIDYLDNCREIANPDQNPSVCIDTDRDGVEDKYDNCVKVYNPTQEDFDEDEIGNVCDNCVYTYNPEQRDSAGDEVGDACRMSGSGLTPPLTPSAPGGSSAIAPTTETLADRVRGGGGCQLIMD